MSLSNANPPARYRPPQIPKRGLVETRVEELSEKGDSSVCSSAERHVQQRSETINAPELTVPAVNHWKDVHAALRRHAIESAESGKPLSVIIVEVDCDFERSRTRRYDCSNVAEKLAHELKAVVRNASELCFYGTNRFLYFLPNTGSLEAAGECERIQELTKAARRNKELSRHVVSTLLSVGWAEYMPDEPLSRFIQRLVENSIVGRADGLVVDAEA